MTGPLDAHTVASVARILPDWLASLQAAHHLTGIQAAIWHDGALAAECAVGPADATTGTPLLPSHRLRIASHSKTFTAMAISVLAGEGRLRLDDTLGAHVQELSGAPVAERTLRDLLSHAAGLTRDSSDARWWQLRRPFADREELLSIARDTAVLAEAGSHLQYSNIGYGLLGLVIESVTGTTYAEAMDALVLTPLGLEDLGPDLPTDAPGPEDPRGFAVGHSAAVLGQRRTIPQTPTGALAPATGFWATAGAAATAFGRVLCDAEIIGARARDTMVRRVWTVSEGRHYGLGVQEGTFHGFAAVGHSGGFPTGLTRTWAVPASRLAVSVLGTAVDSPTSPIAEGVLGLLALAAGRPAPQASAAEDPQAGGGASGGSPRPEPLARQAAVELPGGPLSASDVARAMEGTYEDLWGRARVAELGGRLFLLDDSALDPSQGAIELAVTGSRPDPIDPGRADVELRTWGDVGYGAHLDPVLARVDDGRCSGLWRTGHLLEPTAAL